MDPMVNNSMDDDDDDDAGTAAEQQNQSEGGESGVRPTLSQVRKSWGFRRTTIAKREFMEEVGELTHSPPLVRRSRNRRGNQTSETAAEICNTQKATRTAKSVLDDLQWSAPSSPVSEDGKPGSESSAGVCLDPSLWQDFGSAFHTAFSLLGGNEDLPLTDTDLLPVPDILEATDTIEAPDLQALQETGLSDNMDDMEITQPVAPGIVAQGEISDMLVISSQEEDSDEITLMQIKEQLNSTGSQPDAKARGAKGGRGRARGRGRGRGKGKGKGKGKGRGRGRAVELQSIIAVDEDSSDDVILVNTAEPQHLQEELKENDMHNPPEEVVLPAHFGTLSPVQQLSSDLIILDGELHQSIPITHGQYDDAPEEMEEGKPEVEDVGVFPSISDTKRYNSNTLCSICHQKRNTRFMIFCDSCLDWFHGDCVGVGETLSRKIEREGKEYMCPPCTAKKQFESQPQLDSDHSFPECSTLCPLTEEGVREEEQQTPQETVVVEEEGQALMTRTEAEPAVEPEPEPEAEMETDGSFPLCIGPSCFKQALPDSVYCGTDCILQHAAFTMKTLSGPNMPKSKGRGQRKATTTRLPAKAQKAIRTSKRLAEKALEDADKEEMMEDGIEQEAAASSVACDPSLTDVQSTSIPSSNLHTTSDETRKTIEADHEAMSLSKQCPEDSSAEAPLLSQPAAEEAPPPESPSPEKTNKSESSDVPEEQCAGSRASTPATPTKHHVSPDAQSPTTSAPRHHETGALIVTKTTYVIPKKQSGSQPPSSLTSASASCQKPSSAPALLNETRNLPVSPAPSAPSSRPTQPNNQVRQSIQRSLTSIMFKRVCDCEDLEMSESEAAKLVASIEMEMFDIFRNTDSKYMNKYRTIMFNLKDPRNKGLLYRVVHGEIGPFRLVRMSQKDMQATKAPEPRPKETKEVKDGTPNAINVHKPEAKKVELPNLNPARPDRKPNSMEQKKSLPAPPLKARASQPRQDIAVPDILSCMLKDTTSEHKSHLFDLKCKICTGQILAAEAEEPARKKLKISVSKDKHEPSWRKTAGDDSPLLAPADSPETDSPAFSLMDPPSHLVIDSPKLTIVESPASPVMDSPASPTLESPASPMMESPASPTPETPVAIAPKKSYTPVVIPAVSTVTITRRDPRTAASRFTASSGSTSSPSNTTHNQAAPYAPIKETTASQSAPPSSLPPPKTLPKSILMKPSSTPHPRFYGPSSRTMVSQSPADGDATQFLAKQDILWKGFLNMLTVAKFVTKGYLVSGSAENLKADLPDTIQIGGRILPETVWNYVEKLKTSVTKELCVIRFHPATEEEEVAYVSLFSYFSSRGRFGVVANITRSIKDVYLVPLSAKESVPSILQPLEGPGFEKKRPNLLLGLAIVQKAKRPGNLPQEINEKRPKVNMSKDPMWIPKPPVLYGSDKLDIFQPYDPETPVNTSPPGSTSCPESSSESSSSSSATMPSLLTSIKGTPSASGVASKDSMSSNNSAKNPTPVSSEKTPLRAILKTLFPIPSKQSESVASSESSTKAALRVKKVPVFCQASGSMVDPIVQQYGQKSKVKEIEEEEEKEEENDFDRPYDPEEEYNPAMAYKTVTLQSTEKMETDDSTLSALVDDDVAYDPEDETIFEDIQSGVSETKPPVSTQMLDRPSCPTPVSTSTTAQSSTTAPVIPNIPTGTIVVSAETLSEQQRMLEELNKQIEEQKRQLKEQEEALRQQREAVGMFMAHFSVSDSLMSPPSKVSSPGQLSSLQGGKMQKESMSDKTAQASNLTETKDNPNVDLKTVKFEDTTPGHDLKEDIDTAAEQDKIQENSEENDKYSSTGEIGDSDVAYDPEDESLFDEIQEDVFKGGSTNTSDLSSRAGHKGVSPTSYQSRKRRSSPKRRSRHDRDHHRSPSRRSRQRSRSQSRRRRDRDRHRRTERDRSKHRTREPSERQGHHHKDHTTRQHSCGRKRSSSPRKKHSVSLSPKRHREPCPQVKKEYANVPCNVPYSVVGKLVESKTSFSPVTIKNDPDGQKLEFSLDLSSDKHPLKPIHKVKTEISEQKISDHENSVSDTQVNKTPLQQTFFHDKCENTVPLREIDPPLRDSPESPDPEPQFLKPFNTENNDSTNAEETSLSTEEDTTLSVALVKVENDSLPIGGQAPMPLTATVLQSPDIHVQQGLIKADNQIMAGSFILKHQEMMFPEVGHSNLPSGLDGQCPGPEFDTIAKLSGPVKSCLDIRNLRPDMKECGYRGLQVDLKETGVRFPGPDSKGLGMQGIMPNIWGSGAAIKEQVIDGQGKHVRGPGTCMQGSVLNIREPDIQHQNPNKNESWCVMRGSEMRSQVQDMQRSSLENPGPDMRQKLVPSVSNSSVGESGIQSEKGNLFTQTLLSERAFPDGMQEPKDTRVHVDEGRQNICSLQKGIPCFKTKDFSLQPENSDNRPDAMKIGIPFGGPKLEVMVPHFEHLRSPRRDGDETILSPSCMGFRGSQRQSRHDGSPAFEERSLGKGGFQPHGKDGDLSIVGGGQRNENKQNTINPDWRGPGQQLMNEWKPNIESHVSDRGGFGALEYHQPESNIINQNIQGLRCDSRGFGGTDFMRPGIERKGPEMQFPRHESRGPDLMGQGPEQQVSEMEIPDRRKPVLPDFNRQRPELRNPETEFPMQNRIGPGGAEFILQRSERIAPSMGPGFDRQGLAVEGPEPERRPVGPHFGGPGPERKGQGLESHRTDMVESTGSNFKGPWPERRGPDMVDSGPYWRDPNMESPGTNRRGPGSPDFREPGPVRRGPIMGGPQADRRGPCDPNFRGQGPEGRESSIDGSMHNRRRPGGPDIIRPGPERRGPNMENPGGLGPQDRTLSMEGPEHYGRELGDLEFGEPGHERGNLFMEGPYPHRRGRGHSVFRGPRPQNRFLPMRGPGHEDIGTGDSDFSELGPDSRCPPMGGPEIDRKLPRGPDFSRPEHEMGGPSLDSQGPERRVSTGPNFWGPGSERRAPGCQNTGGQGPDRKRPHIGVPGCSFRGQESERTDPGIEGPGQHTRLGEPHSGVDRTDGGYPNILGNKRSGPDFGRPSSDMAGPPLNRRGRGGPRMGRPGPQHAGINIESPRPSRRGPESSNVRETGPEIIPPNREETEHNRNFPRGPGFRDPESGGMPPHMEGPQCNMREPDFRGVGPDRSMGSQWPIRKGPEGFRTPCNESRDSDMKGPAFNRHRPGDPGLKNSVPGRQCPDMEDPEPDWRESGGPDCRGPGIRQQGRNLETLRRERQNDWRKSEPIQNSPDIEVPGSDRGRRNFRALRPIRRNRGPGPNVWGSAPAGRGTGGEKQWSDTRGPNINASGNERGCSGDNWVECDNWSSGPTQDGSDEHSQTHSRPYNEWTDSGHDRQNVQFPRSRRGRGDDWNGPGGRDSGPVQENSDSSPGPSMEEQVNEWGEPDRGGAGPFFKEERYPDNRGRSCYRGRGRGRGSGMQRNSDMDNDWSQQDFKGNMRDPNMEDFCSDQREFERDGFERRGPGGPDLRHQRPVSEGSFSDYGELGSESHDGEDPGPGRQGFGHAFRGARRGPRMRQGPNKADMRMTLPQSSDFRHGPGRWDTNLEFSESDGTGSDMRDGEQGQMDQNNCSGRRGPHQAARLQDSCDSHSAPFNRSPGPNRGGKSFPTFDKPQNQHAVRPPRRRGGLLPTPAEGPLPFPNHMIKNCDMGHPTNTGPSRGRAMGIRRGRARGRGSPAGNVSPVTGEGRD